MVQQIVVLRSGHTRREVTATAKLAYIPVAATCHLVHPDLYCQKQYTVFMFKLNFIHVLKMMH